MWNDHLILLQTWIENLTSNPFQMAFVPYTSMIGNWFYATFFGFIGGAIHLGSKNIGATLTYFILVGIFFTMIVPSLILTIFGLISGIIIAVILYYGFVYKKT